MSGNRTRKEGLNMRPQSKDIRREQTSEGGRRPARSRVPADPDVGEAEGGGLTDMRSARKADSNVVTMFRKV